MNLLDHRPGRGLIAFAFYFAEGAPIGFIWWAMPTLMRQHGIDVGVIGTITATLTLPWVFKFLWAPLVDVLRTERFGFRKWIALSQSGMCLSLLPLVFIPISGNITWWLIFLLLHSLCAATQDVSVDALVINVVSQKETGMLNGYMQAGMLIGRSLFGGGALIFMKELGLPFTIGVMILIILGTMAILLFIKDPPVTHTRENGIRDFRKHLRESFLTKRTWYAIAFALTAASAFEATGAMAGPFLTDHQASMESIGFFFGIPVVISMLLGGLSGGFLSDRMKRKVSVSIFLLGFVTMVLSISVIGYLYPGAGSFTWITLLTGMYFFTGMFTASSYALFMDITDPKLGATQFSTFMAATNGCESLAVWMAGLIAASHGYSPAFAVMCFVSLLSLFFLRRILIEQ